MSALERYLSGSMQGIQRGGNALRDTLVGALDHVPKMPFAEAGIRSYDGALTGTDVPYYGDDEISAAREYFDRKPKSSTIRLIDLIGNYMAGAATGPRTAVQGASRAVQQAAPPPAMPPQEDSIRAIMEDLRRGRAEAEARKDW